MTDPDVFLMVLLLIGTPIICILPAFIQALRQNKEDDDKRD